MFEKIVVLLDGSTLAQYVLPHTRSLAQIYDTHVTLLHVVEPQDKTDTGRLDPVNWHMRKIEAGSFLSTLAREWKTQGKRLDTKLLEGNAANRIIEYVDETNPDLIVMSSHGQSGLSAWNVNSVAQKIIYGAFRSFMLIRPYQQPGEGTAKAHYRRIAVPLDGSKRAQCALPIAARLAAVHNAELLLIHALAPPLLVQSHTLTPAETVALDLLSEHNRLGAEQYLEQMMAQVKSKASPHLLTGANPADALLEFVHQNEVDLVVMSAHGYSGETTRPYGSVVSSFITYGRTSLLIIQDLSPEQIKPSQASLNVVDDEGRGAPNRNIAHAQPSDWSTS